MRACFNRIASKIFYRRGLKWYWIALALLTDLILNEWLALYALFSIANWLILG